MYRPESSSYLDEKYVLETPHRDLVLALSDGGKASLAFQTGALLALVDLGIMARVRVCTASGTGNLLLAVLSDAYELGGWAVIESKDDARGINHLRNTMHDYCTHNHEKDMLWTRFKTPSRWFSADMAHEYTAVAKSSVMNRCFPRLVNTGGARSDSMVTVLQAETTGGRLLCLSNDLNIVMSALSAAASDCIVSTFASHESVLSSAGAAMACPLAFGSGRAKIGEAGTQSLPVWSSTASDPLALHSARMYFTKLKLGAADGTSKLVLLDGFHRSPLYESRSTHERRRIKAEYATLCSSASVLEGDALRLFGSRSLSMFESESASATVLESRWLNYARHEWDAQGVHALPEQAFFALVNWGFRVARFRFATGDTSMTMPFTEKDEA